MCTRIFYPLVLTMFLVVAQGPAASAATVYRCEGPRGDTVFSQVPCGPHAVMLETGPVNTALPPVEMARRGAEPPLPSAQRGISAGSAALGRQDFACQEARDRIASLQDRWRDVRLNGYTIEQERSYAREMRMAERRARNRCR